MIEPLAYVEFRDSFKILREDLLIEGRLEKPAEFLFFCTEDFLERGRRNTIVTPETNLQDLELGFGFARGCP